MFAEYITFLIIFVATSGIAVISILTSYQIFQKVKKSELQLLLYQQIFLFTFYIYSIWGNLALRQVMTDAIVNPQISAKLALFLPMLGIPFMIISWFMLLKFSLNLNQYRFTGTWVYIYFAAYLLIFSAAVYLFQAGYFRTPSNPDRFLIRAFIPLNLFIHLLFFLPFIKPNSNKDLHYQRQDMHKCLIIYLSGTALCSVVLWFLGSLGFVYSAVSILLLFTSSALLPVCIKFLASFVEDKPAVKTNNFDSFCKEYSISKREKEIILEICDGKSNKAIAEKLFITLQTVKDHTHRIYTKTNVKSRVQLANLVRQKTGNLKTSAD